jgi:hypothetical protein
MRLAKRRKPAVADHVQRVQAQWFACLTPKLLLRSMRAGVRAAEAAAHAPGGITRYAIASLVIPAARAALVGDVPRRQTHHRQKEAIA